MSPEDRSKPAEMLWADQFSKSDYDQFSRPTATAGGITALGSSGFTGEIVMYPIKTPPDGWLQCNGQLVNAEEYPDLFNVLNKLLSPITVNASNNRVTFTGASEQLVVGDRVMFTTDDTLPDPLEAGKVYFVWDFPATDEFRLAEQMEPIPIIGNIIDITDTGTGTHMIYHTPYAIPDVDDNETVFSLPDFTRRFPLGIDTESGGVIDGYDIIGGKSGTEVHSHTIAAHTHSLDSADGAAAYAKITTTNGGVFTRLVSGLTSWTSNRARSWSSVSTPSNTSPTEGAEVGGITAESDILETETADIPTVMPPALHLNFIIKT